MALGGVEHALGAFFYFGALADFVPGQAGHGWGSPLLIAGFYCGERLQDLASRRKGIENYELRITNGGTGEGLTTEAHGISRKGSGNREFGIVNWVDEVGVLVL